MLCSFHGVSVIRVIKLTFVTFSFVIILFFVIISLAWKMTEAALVLEGSHMRRSKDGPDV